MPKRKAAAQKGDPIVEVFKNTLVACERCGKKFEYDTLVNIAFMHPYNYTICGRCNSMPRSRKRLILNQLIQRIQDDNSNT